jgi:membrane-bound inhibitor of C-type lysozyme
MSHSAKSTPIPVVACLCLLLSGCAAVNKYNPFGGGVREQDLTRAPQGATTYQCDGGKRLFVRYLDNNAAAWVILHEREFRLEKAAVPTGARYTNGSTTLDENGTEIALTEGNIVTYASCKQQAAR